jgi:hypothetical protein
VITFIKRSLKNERLVITYRFLRYIMQQLRSISYDALADKYIQLNFSRLKYHTPSKKVYLYDDDKCLWRENSKQSHSQFLLLDVMKTLTAWFDSTEAIDYKKVAVGSVNTALSICRAVSIDKMEQMDSTFNPVHLYPFREMVVDARGSPCIFRKRTSEDVITWTSAFDMVDLTQMENGMTLREMCNVYFDAFQCSASTSWLIKTCADILFGRLPGFVITLSGKSGSGKTEFTNLMKTLCEKRLLCQMYGKSSFMMKQRDECYSANRYTLLQVEDEALPLREHELHLTRQIVFHHTYTTPHQWTALRMNAIFTFLTEQV